MNSQRRELCVNSGKAIVRLVAPTIENRTVASAAAAWPSKTASIEVGPAGAANMRLAHWAAPACLTTPSSMVDQYAEDGCGQHRTEHDIDRFKCVAVPHQNCPYVTTAVFKSWILTGSKFSMLRYGIRLAHQGKRELWSFGVISAASVTAAEEELGISFDRRTVLAVPLEREGETIGIRMRRLHPRASAQSENRQGA
jgi:hypothetical protein